LISYFFSKISSSSLPLHLIHLRNLKLNSCKTSSALANLKLILNPHRLNLVKNRFPSLPEPEEFAEALLSQLSVELNEEKQIADLHSKINEDASFSVKFEELESISEKLVPELKQKIEEFLGISAQQVNLKFPDLKEFKILKGNKVFSKGFRNSSFVVTHLGRFKIC